jgi:hypothetical protein
LWPHCRVFEPECTGARSPGPKRTFRVDHSSPREAFEGIADR